MALPDPKPGLVVCYDYLWTHDAAAGRNQGKTRPACLIAATDPATVPRHVVFLPITHTPPADDTVGIEIPARVRQALGLDDMPTWVILSEHNIDVWPNGGLSPLPGQPETFSCGYIPPGLFAQIKALFLELARASRAGRCTVDHGTNLQLGQFGDPQSLAPANECLVTFGNTRPTSSGAKRIDGSPVSDCSVSTPSCPVRPTVRVAPSGHAFH